MLAVHDSSSSFQSLDEFKNHSQAPKSLGASDV
jgi:hypothetical protein